MAKSITVVTPPRAAARVPVFQSSLETVPQKGSSRCTCTSMPPGITYLPVASTRVVSLLALRARSLPIAAIFSPWMATSACSWPSALITVPLATMVSYGMASLPQRGVHRIDPHFSPRYRTNPADSTPARNLGSPDASFFLVPKQSLGARPMRLGPFRWPWSFEILPKDGSPGRNPLALPPQLISELTRTPAPLWGGNEAVHSLPATMPVDGRPIPSKPALPALAESRKRRPAIHRALSSSSLSSGEP